MYRQKFQFLISARRLMMLYISIKIHENILNGFAVTERTRNYHCIVEFEREVSLKLYRQELRFLCSESCLMMFNISIKFHENILNGFQVIELRRNEHCQISKGNNYTSE